MKIKLDNTANKGRANIIILIAVLALFMILSGLQYFFTWQGIDKEKANLERIVQNVKAEQINQVKKEVGMAISNVAIAYEQQIDNPDGFNDLSVRLLRNNPKIAGCCVAFIPDYYPDKGHFYAPYVFRKDDQLIRKILTFDYTKREWYISVMREFKTGWCEPYEGEGGLNVVMTTYSCPLRNKEGRVVATLVADVPVSDLSVPVPDSYQSVSQRSLIILVIQMFSLLLIGGLTWRAAKSFVSYNKVSKENMRINDELMIGHRLQEAMIPEKLPKHDNVEIAGKLTSSNEVGGDFYDVVLKDDKLFFCIGDESSNGIGAALAMAITRSVYRTIIGIKEEPGEILSCMNRALSSINERQMFATMFVGVLDLKTGHLSYSNGGHVAPIVVGAEGATPLEVQPNVPIGITEWEFEEQECELQKGQTLFLYTDGLTEVHNAQGDLLGVKRLNLHLRNAGDAGETAQQLLKRVEGVVTRFAFSTEVADDWVILAIRYI